MNYKLASMVTVGQRNNTHQEITNKKHPALENPISIPLYKIMKCLPFQQGLKWIKEKAE